MTDNHPEAIKVLTVIGARPQFVKAAAVSRAIAAYRPEAGKRSVHEVIVHTGQHYDSGMSDIFFDEMAIPRPDHRLLAGGLSHGAMTGRMLEKVEGLILKEAPDAVLVYGDTNTTLAGALAAAKLHVPVAHVEAGLRSWNRRMPEEINRVMTDHISAMLFCPTDTAMENLAREGITGPRGMSGDGFPLVDKSGDVMLDAALFYATVSGARSTVLKEGGALRERLGRLGNRASGFGLVTVHRADNTDEFACLEGILSALEKVSGSMPLVFPAHPRTQNAMKKHGLFPKEGQGGVMVIDPVGYFDMLELLKHCSLVLTDSGGLQKEAYFFQKPCVTLREETEWVELVRAGANTLAGSSPARILAACREMAGKAIDFDSGLYGNGAAAQRVVDVLCKRLAK